MENLQGKKDRRNLNSSALFHTVNGALFHTVQGSFLFSDGALFHTLYRICHTCMFF